MNRRDLMFIPLIAGLLAVGGCAVWRTPSGELGPGLLGSRPRMLRVTMRDHRPFVLHSPRLEGDNLIGFVPTRGTVVAAPAGNLLASKPEERISVAVADIASVETRKTDLSIVPFALLPLLTLVAIVGFTELSHGPTGK